MGLSSHTSPTIAASLGDSAGDIGALADQFEAAGLDSLAANGIAVNAFVVTNAAAAAAGLCWAFLEWIRNGKPTVFGIVTGSIAGLATVTPASALAVFDSFEISIILFNFSSDTAMPPKGILEPVVAVPPPDAVTGVRFLLAWVRSSDSSFISSGKTTLSA